MKQPTWASLLVTCGMCLLGGFFYGANYAAKNMPQSTQSVGALATWTKRAETCEDKFETATVLYEPGAEPSIPLMHGLVNLTPGSQLGIAAPDGPHWIIPAKVSPRAVGSAQGLEYYYLDLRTDKFDGPYLAGSIQKTDRFHEGELIRTP